MLTPASFRSALSVGPTATAALLLACSTLTAQTPLVVETPPLSPEEQRQQFQLPSGFHIELLASEPDIGQPMNLNFDAAGRLWVTHSVEYPYPVEGPGVEPRDERFGPNGAPPARDRISVISGIGTDNLKITHVIDGLNIPIGLVPMSTTSVVAYSIPNLSRITIPAAAPNGETDQLINKSTDQLLGPFGNVDTHGMVNGLTHWIDGWIYACHGFRNTSTIEDAAGREITMNSGNTFRFKPDGSRIEQWTWGQVNPFGMTFDPWGHVYTADCHSKPLTCLIPGAYYSSFGKPHDGLGFGPDMIDHSHGSTGICGPCYYAADHFPEDYRDNIYLCNPVTGIVHRDKLVWHGATPQVDTQPDFITCKDGWFRPVDIQLGPDGALYVADFYNAIIGHYEVPLEDPRRDRTHGRIWRVTYTGDAQASGGRQSPDDADQRAMPNLTGDSLNDLIARLDDPNLTVRVLASHLIVERADERTPQTLRASLQAGVSSLQHAHLLWLLQQLGSLTRDDWATLTSHESPLLRTHAVRLAGNLSRWEPIDAAAVSQFLQDEDARVQRAAAEAWAAHPTPRAATPLLEALPAADTPDTHLRHALRIALRNSVQLPGALSDPATASGYLPEVASVCLAIPTQESAVYLLNVLDVEPQPREGLEWTSHIARHGTREAVAALINILREPTQKDFPRQVAALRAIKAATDGAPARRPEAFAEWASAVVTQLLERVRDQPETWQSLPLPGSARPAVEWNLETRSATDGRQTLLWSSLPGGEQGVGIARSPVFTMPQTLTFWLCGHDGFPANDSAGTNLARLVRDADGAVLQTQAVPRQDPPVKVTWEAGEHADTPVRIELVDSLDLDAYAWIAAGRFSTANLNPQRQLPSALAAELITSLELTDLRPQLLTLLDDPGLPESAAIDLMSVLLEFSDDVRLHALRPWLSAASQSPISQRLKAQLKTPQNEAIAVLLQDAMRAASSERQLAMADVLAGRREGAAALVALIQQGHASGRLLQSPGVLQKLAAATDAALQERIKALVAGLPPASDEAALLVRRHRTSFDPAAASSERGREVFKKTCAACHQIGDEGKKVGPQLDGIGIRGLDRLLEDTIDPNRNVDAAFRSTTIVTTDGQVLTGLLRREEPETLVLADNKGEEFRVATVDIEEQALSPLSLMPADIAQQLPDDQLYDLLAFLLAQRQPSP
jgi:putative heme-binding domain-containing protein